MPESRIYLHSYLYGHSAYEMVAQARASCCSSELRPSSYVARLLTALQYDQLCGFFRSSDRCLSPPSSSYRAGFSRSRRKKPSKGLQVSFHQILASVTALTAPLVVHFNPNNCGPPVFISVIAGVVARYDLSQRRLIDWEITCFREACSATLIRIRPAEFEHRLLKKTAFARFFDTALCHSYVRLKSSP